MFIMALYIMNQSFNDLACKGNENYMINSTKN